MAKRTAEKQFVKRSFAKVDEHFYEKNCSSCHVDDCLDCHGQDGHRIARPTQQDCAACHKGYYVGMDYYGKAPREENQRYQRGQDFAGERVLKMQPDLHAEMGMDCGACHQMQGLLEGQRTSKNCKDCHKPDPAVIEHAITAHLEKLECYACHSAWAAQEYGTFYVRLGDNPIRKRFRLKNQSDGDYVRSVYLKKQDAPPLGLNEKGLVSPIRPQFIGYYSDLRKTETAGEKNRLLATEWKAFFPHTVRTGTPMCEGCHGNNRRFLLETDEQRIYLLQEEGMGLTSFWQRNGQTVSNGSFFPKARYEQMSVKSAEYTWAYVKKWKQLIENVATSSRD